MAVIMIMEWEGVTPEQYEAVRKEVNWESNHAPGGQFHVAAFAAVQQSGPREGHDEHHQHAHDDGVATTEPHSHPHQHQPLHHIHAHTPDLHHRHSHAKR